MTNARLRHGLKAFVLVALLVAASQAAANVKGRARASLGDAPETWLGQQVNVYLDLETTGFSFADVHFSLPEVDGAVFMQTDTTTIKLSDTRNGESWQVLRYPLVLFPQKAGAMTVPPLSVRFRSASSFGAESRRFDLQTESLTLNVQRPPGTAAGVPVVTTPAFELSYRREPEGRSLRTGDALQLSVTRRAQGVSGMFLDPIQFPAIDGLSAYPEPPVIEDRVERGALTGERIDAITWVFEEPGRCNFPELRFQWWDPGANQLRRSTVPPLAVDVTAGPFGAGQGSGIREDGRPIRWAWPILAVTIIGAIAWAWRRRPGRSRPGKIPSPYDALVEACRANDASLAYAQLSAWVAELSPASPAWTPSEYARRMGNPKFVDTVLELQLRLLDKPETWRGSSLLNALSAIRQISRRAGAAPAGYDLPELNPSNRSRIHA